MALPEATLEVFCFLSPPPFRFLADDRRSTVDGTWWSRLYVRGRPDVSNSYFYFYFLQRINLVCMVWLLFLIKQQLKIYTLNYYLSILAKGRLTKKTPSGEVFPSAHVAIQHGDIKPRLKKARISRSTGVVEHPFLACFVRGRHLPGPRRHVSLWPQRETSRWLFPDPPGNPLMLGPHCSVQSPSQSAVEGNLTGVNRAELR